MNIHDAIKQNEPEVDDVYILVSYHGQKVLSGQNPYRTLYGTIVPAACTNAPHLRRMRLLASDACEWINYALLSFALVPSC